MAGHDAVLAALLFFCFGVALVKEKWDLASVLARSCSTYQSAKNYKNIPNGLSPMAIFAY